MSWFIAITSGRAHAVGKPSPIFESSSAIQHETGHIASEQSIASSGSPQFSRAVFTEIHKHPSADLPPHSGHAGKPDIAPSNAQRVRLAPTPQRRPESYPRDQNTRELYTKGLILRHYTREKVMPQFEIRFLYGPRFMTGLASSMSLMISRILHECATRPDSMAGVTHSDL